MKNILKNPRAWYAALLVIFLAFRLFTANEAYFISGDEAKYLKGALTFPKYLVWNNQFDVYNPPVLSALFAINGWVFGDLLRGAQIVELFFAILFFIYCIKLFKLLGKPDPWIWIAMLFISLAHEMIMMAYRLYKEQVYVALFVMMLYYFLRALRGENRHYITAAVIGAVTAYTADHMFLFIPIMALMLAVFCTKKTSVIKALACIALISIVYCSWLGIRVWVYETNDWYPVGVDGTPEYVRDYGLRQILSPPAFPDTMALTGYYIGIRPAHAAAYLAYLLNLEPGLIPTDLTYDTAQALLGLKPVLLMILLYIPLIAVILFGAWRSRKSLFTTHLHWKFLRGNIPFFFAATYLILNIFIIYRGFSNRYSLGAMIPLAFFLTEGISALARKFKLDFSMAAKALIVIALIVLVPLHLASHRTFVLAIPFEADAQNTALFLAGLPGDGIMVQAGYTPEITWLTHPKRVLSLPRTPEHFESLIKKYDVHYVAFGERYWAAPTPENKEKVWDYDAIDYIRSNPAQFELLKTITEQYQASDADKLYVYRVR